MRRMDGLLLEVSLFSVACTTTFPPSASTFLVSIQRYTSPTPPPDAKLRMASPPSFEPPFMAAVTAHPATTAAPVTSSILVFKAPYSRKPSKRISSFCSGVSLTNALGRSSMASLNFSPHGKETEAEDVNASSVSVPSSVSNSDALAFCVTTRTSTSSNIQSPPCSGATQIAHGMPMSGASKTTSSTLPRSNRGYEYMANEESPQTSGYRSHLCMNAVPSSVMSMI